MRLLAIVLLLALPVSAAGSAFVNCLSATSVERLVASDAVIPLDAANASADVCSVSSPSPRV